ncbi:MAG: hypothetical protein JSS28_03045 [Proteobacteria bacterium]|nr:hypothetical protein [Pseudomonadota bacterium]
MRTRIGWIIGIGLALSACGAGRSDQAAAACNVEIAKRVGGRGYTVDLKDLAAHARQESPDTLLLTSTVILDQGLPSQDKQAFECRVRFDASGAASVLFLQFNWNTSDLKQPQQP